MQQRARRGDPSKTRPGAPASPVRNPRRAARAHHDEGRILSFAGNGVCAQVPSVTAAAPRVNHAASNHLRAPKRAGSRPPLPHSVPSAHDAPPRTGPRDSSWKIRLGHRSRVRAHLNLCAVSALPASFSARACACACVCVFHTHLKITNFPFLVPTM